MLLWSAAQVFAVMKPSMASMMASCCRAASAQPSLGEAPPRSDSSPPAEPSASSKSGSSGTRCWPLNTLSPSSARRSAGSPARAAARAGDSSRPSSASRTSRVDLSRYPSRMVDVKRLALGRKSSLSKPTSRRRGSICRSSAAASFTPGAAEAARGPAPRRARSMSAEPWERKSDATFTSTSRSSGPRRGLAARAVRTTGKTSSPRLV
mmetsp:Transcript_1212/g.3422  ORF Transcript_1212/g.3422 Transcript_1212/m.3422 type:complete len:208 (-) Transcript_1212:347-970(-)